MRGAATLRRLRASRSAVLVAVIVLHLAGMALALRLKAPPTEVEPDTSSIQLLLINEPEQQGPPAMPVLLPEITAPQVVIPLVNIELPVSAPAEVVAVAPNPVAPPVAASAPVATADGDADAPVVISNAEWVRRPAPVYPAAAKRARAQGVVEVRALVDANGRALKARVHRSSGIAALDKAACESVLAALFRPYLQNGVARSVEVIVPIAFALASREGDRAPSRVARSD